jgi:hypothetical protein
MTRIALTLAFAVLSLGFAPAPFPRAEWRPETGWQRATRECRGRLEALGVRWRLERLEGGSVLVFSLRLRDGSQTREKRVEISDGNVLGMLQQVARYAQQIYDLETGAARR